MSKSTNAKKQKKTAVVKQPKVRDPSARIRKKPTKKGLRGRAKRVQADDLASSLSLAAKSFRLIKVNSRTMVSFFMLYAVLTTAFVSGVVAPLNIDSVRDELAANGAETASVSGNFATLGLILRSSFRASGDVPAVTQAVFIIVSALALIWLFRQQQAGNSVSLRDAYYRGMYPLIPFFLLVVLIVIQTLPGIVGSFIYGTVIAGGHAVTVGEQVTWILLYLSTIIMSIYLIVPSLMALFIVTLPEMTPSLAYTEAKELVSGRRTGIFLRVVLLLFIVAGIYIGLVFPALFLSAVLAQLVYFVLTIMVVPFVVGYLYALYRELL